jgi:hypothetical protein
MKKIWDEWLMVQTCWDTHSQISPSLFGFMGKIARRIGFTMIHQFRLEWI